MAVKPIPEGYHSVSPALTIDGATEAIDFYKRAFGASERMRMPTPDGKVAHAELDIGDSVVMLSDPFPQSTVKAPTELGGTTVSIFVYVEDVDAVFQRAVDAGATVTMPLDDMFWGDRFGSLTDPYGHSWSFATHVEDVPPQEMEERAKQAMAAMGSGGADEESTRGRVHEY
ncbi:MAG: VOC family protein [Actinomycetota bacterium]|nr:VOC family protein [Actinomycetota bacterium]